VALMANTPTVDVMAAKLRARYPTAPPRAALADLLFLYWNDPAYGANKGRPKGGDAVWAHWGGTAKMLADRQQDYWLNRFP
jgi:hypothetical protein